MNWCHGVLDGRADYDDLARKQRNKGGRSRVLYFARMDITALPTVAERFGVRQDALLLFKGGEAVGTLRGKVEDQTVRAIPLSTLTRRFPTDAHPYKNDNFGTNSPPP